MKTWKLPIPCLVGVTAFLVTSLTLTTVANAFQVPDNLNQPSDPAPPPDGKVKPKRSDAPTVRVESVAGRVVKVGKETLVVQVGESKENVEFSISDDTAIFANKREAELSAIQEGDTVMITVPLASPTRALEVKSARLTRTEKPDEKKERPPKRSSKEQSDSEQPLNRKYFTSNQAGLGVVVGPAPRGTLVLHVMPDTPADLAGIAFGDFITKVGRKEVTSPRQFVSQIFEKEPGDDVVLAIWREGKTMSSTIPLTGRSIAPDEALSTNRVLDDALQDRRKGRRQGRRNSERPQPLDRRWGVTFGKGDRVTLSNVRSNGFAASAGFRPDDVIVSAGGQDVGSIDDLNAAVADATAGPLAVEIIRDGERQRLNVPIQQQIRRRQERRRRLRQQNDRKQNDRQQNDRQQDDRRQNDRQQNDRRQTEGRDGERQPRQRQLRELQQERQKQNRGNPPRNSDRNDFRPGDERSKFGPFEFSPDQNDVVPDRNDFRPDRNRD